MTIRVLDLRDTYDIGGPGKTILETYRFIDSARFDLHLGVFLVSGEPVETPFLSEARRYGMPVHLIHAQSRYDPRLVTRTAALSRRLSIDILHAHEVKSDVVAYAAARLRPTPLVTTMHGWIANSRRQQVLIGLDKAVARRYDRVIAVSAKIERDLTAAGVRPDRVRLIHNGIVPERYRRNGTEGFVRAALGGEPDGPVLVCIGRLSAEKGHADFLEALGHVVRNGHRVSAVIAGEGPERAKLEQQVRTLGLVGRVALPGHIDRPQRLLEEAALMVLPSHTEGLPNAALEALVMDVPVLATSVGGTPEVIEDGRTGRLVPPNHPRAIATAIEAFLSDRGAWAAMAAAGHARVLERFDFRARTRKVEALYCEMLETS